MRKKVSIKGAFRVFTTEGKEIIYYKPTDSLFHTYLINGNLMLDHSSEIDGNNIYEIIELESLPKTEKENVPIDLNLVPIEGYTNKAATIAEKQYVFFNKDFFKKLNLFEKMFVIGHELGHRYYFNEHACDLFALHFCVRNFVDVRFINFDKVLTSPIRKYYIKNFYKIKRIKS